MRARRSRGKSSSTRFTCITCARCSTRCAGCRRTRQRSRERWRPMAGEITFEGWAVLELMGHRQRAGYVKDVEMFGGKLLRIDVPVGEGITEFYGCSSIYALRPCTEQIARDHVK